MNLFWVVAAGLVIRLIMKLFPEKLNEHDLKVLQSKLNHINQEYQAVEMQEERLIHHFMDEEPLDQEVLRWKDAESTAQKIDQELKKLERRWPFGRLGAMVIGGAALLSFIQFINLTAFLTEGATGVAGILYMLGAWLMVKSGYMA